jgi:hypothetical protein
MYMPGGVAAQQPLSEVVAAREFYKIQESERDDFLHHLIIR